MAELFQRNKSSISRHIKNVLEDEELDEDSVVAFFATTTKHGAIEGKTQEHQVAFYKPRHDYQCLTGGQEVSLTKLLNWSE